MARTPLSGCEGGILRSTIASGTAAGAATTTTTTTTTTTPAAAAAATSTVPAAAAAAHLITSLLLVCFCQDCVSRGVERLPAATRKSVCEDCGCFVDPQGTIQI